MAKAISNIFSNIIDRLELREMEVILFLPFLPIIAAIDLYKAIYIPFIAVMAIRILKVRKKEMTIAEAIIGLCIYTIILPDNYVILIFVAALFVTFLKAFLVNRDYKNLMIYVNKHKRLFAALVIFLMLNILLNRVPLQNIFFELVYYSVFIVLLIICNYGTTSYEREVSRTINAVVFIEFIYLIIFIPLKFYVIKFEFIGDWSVGTLGISEGTTLFILYAYALIKYLHQYAKTRDLYFIFFAVLCFLGMITAVNVSLTLFFIVSVVIYSLGFIRGIKSKIVVVSVAVLMMTIFWNVSDPWIRDGIYRTFTDANYREERVKKLKTYRDTFITIPSRDIKFLLIGNGIGNYSSRAALTVSGYYVPWFSNSNLVRISEYTSYYIRPEIYAQYGVSQTDTPSSQYITVMGEFGIIGLLVFMFSIFRIFFKESNINRLSIIFFTCILLIDNYLEFYKIILIFCCSFYCIRHSKLVSS